MLELLGSISWLLFVVFVTLSQLRSVLKQRAVATHPFLCSRSYSPGAVRVSRFCHKVPGMASLPVSPLPETRYSG
jgi:hypothetical protein